MDHQMLLHFQQRQFTSFVHQADTMPRGRVKVIHPGGLVGLFKFVVTYKNPFSGVFQSGCEGVMRFSDLANGVSNKIDMTPTFAWKCLIDYLPSQNAFAAVHGDGTKSWNFFRNTFYSSVEPTTNECAADSNGRHAIDATVYTSTTSVREMGIADRYGNVSKKIITPFKLKYEPTGVFQFPDEFHGDWNDDLIHIPPYTKLFRVSGCLDHDYCIPIGFIESLTPFIKSHFGDNLLFFKHTPFELDVKEKPELGGLVHNDRGKPSFIES